MYFLFTLFLHISVCLGRNSIDASNFHLSYSASLSQFTHLAKKTYFFIALMEFGRDVAHIDTEVCDSRREKEETTQAVKHHSPY
jgi:hypothetical protein